MDVRTAYAYRLHTTVGIGTLCVLSVPMLEWCWMGGMLRWCVGGRQCLWTLISEASNSTVRGETSGLARGRALLSAHAVACQEMVGILQEFARRIRGRIDVFR